jgi:hypothetical protein
MTTFAFSATVTGLDLDSPTQLDSLFTETMLILPAEVDGVTSLSVELDAASGEDALTAFTAFLSSTDVTLVRVDPDLVNVPEIAIRLGVSRETVRLWAAGARGDAHFPIHRTVVGSQKVWPWADVHAWALVQGRLDPDEPAPLDSACVDWINGQASPVGSTFAVVYVVTPSRQLRRSWTEKRHLEIVGATATGHSNIPYIARNGPSYQWSDGRVAPVGAAR